MTRYQRFVSPVIFVLLFSCSGHRSERKETRPDTAAAGPARMADTARVKIAADTTRPGTTGTSFPTLSAAQLRETEELMKHYPGARQAALRRYLASLRKEWAQVPSPFTAAYQGNDFGDYQHILFKDARGRTYDFGQAANHFSPYTLFTASGQYADNPLYLGKTFTIWWDWKLTGFLCCEGEYDQAKAYLPAITKLELIKH